MGRSWRRITEAVRQKVGPIGPVGDAEFQTTSNRRNEAMFAEARDFSLQIKVMEKDLEALERQVEVQFANLRNILVATLPRVFDGDGVTPIENHANTNQIIGQNVNVDQLGEALHNMREGMNADVFMPMNEWMKDYKRVQSEMRRLEAMRLEVDSRRRTVTDLDRQLTSYKMKSLRRAQTTHKTTGAPYAEDFKMKQMISETDAKKVHKEEKLQTSQTRFAEHEVVVFNSLFTLIEDARSLKDYAATALAIVQDCFSEALTAFDGAASLNVSASLNASHGIPQQQQQQIQARQTAATATIAAAAGPQKVPPIAGGKTGMFAALGKLMGGGGGGFTPQRDDASGRVTRQYDQFDAVVAPHGKIPPPPLASALPASGYDRMAPQQQQMQQGPYGHAYIQQASQPAPEHAAYQQHQQYTNWGRPAADVF